MIWTRLGMLLVFLMVGPQAISQEEGEVQEELDPASVIEDLNEAADETASPESVVEGEEEYEEDQEYEDDGEYEGEEESQESPQPEPRKAMSKPTSQAMSNTAEEDNSIFGDYKIHIGVTKPEFDKSDEYELIYGDTRFYPTMSVERYFFDWYATLGAIFRFGYYKDDGNAVIQNGTDFDQDEDGKTELTLVPLQVGLSAQMTPFPAKWISLSGWFAAEATYFQEIRKNQETATTSTSSSDESTTSDSSSSSNNEVLTNQGWRYGTNIGVALSLLLNGLDETSISSMRYIGISAVYFTPYVETTAGMLNDSDLDFTRLAYGAAFTFETF